MIQPCLECASIHPKIFPHNMKSAYYKAKFKSKCGRYPTWIDAMNHCDDIIKEIWIDELKKAGELQ